MAPRPSAVRSSTPTARRAAGRRPRWSRRRAVGRLAGERPAPRPGRTCPRPRLVPAAVAMAALFPRRRAGKPRRGAAAYLHGSYAALPPRCRLQPHRRPAARRSTAIAKRSTRATDDDAARRHRHGQDDDDGRRRSSGCRGPTLVMAHNKTLAAQLCNEFRTYFPRERGRVLRLLLRLLPARGLRPVARTSTSRRTRRSTRRSTACATPRRPRCSRRRDVLIVASVSAIFGLGSPETYNDNLQILNQGRRRRPRRAAAQAGHHPVQPQRHRRWGAARSGSAARRWRSSRPTPRPPSARRSSATRSSACSSSTR